VVKGRRAAFTPSVRPAVQLLFVNPVEHFNIVSEEGRAAESQRLAAWI